MPSRLEYLCLFWITCFAVCDQPVDAQTDDLYNTIRNNVNTTRFADFIDALEMKKDFVEASCTSGQPQCLTVFVPNNEAVELITQLPQWNELSLASKRLVIWGHILKDTKRITAVDWSQMGMPQNLKDVGFGTGRSVSFGFSITHYAFQSQLGNNLVYFIDVARLVQPDISASNGMVHVVNQMLFMPWENTNFYEYISQQKNLQLSAELWFQLGNTGNYQPFVSQQQGSSPLYSTFFVPTDEAWKKLPGDKLTMLKSNTSLLAEVFASQYLPNQIVYSQWTADYPRIMVRSGFPSTPLSPDWSKTISSMLSRESDGRILISSGAAQSEVVGHGVEIKQAVVHTINSVLGFVYETREEIVQRLNPTLWQACQADQNCQSMLNTQAQLTFFVPTNQAMMRFNQMNSTQKSKFLRYLVVPGQIEVQEMTSDSYITIDGLVKAIRFRLTTTDIYVEGRLPGRGYVGGRLINVNQVATNGIAHVIDHIPGLPYQTVQQYLAQTPEFSKYSEYRFVETLTEGGPYIYFAPTNEALQSMENDATLGLRLLGDLDKRTCIFQRITFPLLKLFADLPAGYYGAPTANFAFFRERLNITVPSDKTKLTVRYFDQFTVIAPAEDAYQLSNGCVYKINRVFYRQEDMNLMACIKPKRN
ncbi:hypothetical protein CRM22_002985 [Opisthorchis felineus]|uniref:FAS1 domain-containing protein n=1 Tax=Opisthorchis felineus TaxID=147828 RepID=A0A4V3SG33_OPIFE|nr:hypothetical protein CRM22_002985 [Opisthorchis felineus]